MSRGHVWVWTGNDKETKGSHGHRGVDTDASSDPLWSEPWRSLETARLRGRPPHANELNFMYLFGEGTSMPWLEYGGQRTTRGSWFFPLIVWIWRLNSSYCAWQQSPLATEPSLQLNPCVLNLQRMEGSLKGNSAFLCRDWVTNWLDFC